ncbi:MAG: sigma-54-dependent Fis family transcriptional regulator [Deltaproteobacteria bacterium]|nr:sigma-54-dependent Fis family transcriptional regulator [Deltaproteobacteria bacterium]
MSKQKILIIDDEHLIRWSLSQPLIKQGYLIETAASGAEAQNKLAIFKPHMVLLDIRLPDANGLELLERFKNEDKDLIVIMITAYADVGSAVEAFKFGAEDYIGKPFNLEAVKNVIAQAFAKKKLNEEVEESGHTVDQKIDEDRLIGNSPEMIDVFKIIKRCAETNDKTVLILGQSGTGKELVAKAVHLYSQRSKAPFFEINCAAIPENLLENELFGHEKGAYTDAGKRHKGIFELADGGTVFLDEIGDMPLPMQGKILKAIENKRYRRLGGDRDIDVNVRIIAATNRALKKMVEDGRFRADLYYRLNVMTINLPPLKERKADIPHLARYFIELFNNEYNRNIEDISPAALDLMLAYDWPGNVRELRNSIERALILEDGRTLSRANLNLSANKTENGPEKDSDQTPPITADGETNLRCERLHTRTSHSGELQITLPAEGVSFEDLEKNIIQLALEKHAGNQTKAAQYLQLSRDTLRYRMKKFDLQ